MAESVSDRGSVLLAARIKNGVSKGGVQGGDAPPIVSAKALVRFSCLLPSASLFAPSLR